MEIFKALQKSILNNKEKNAFLIDDTYFSYQELAQSISNIRNSLKKEVLTDDINIGLVTNDDIETYAAIIALWFEGKAYVPLNPSYPIHRNKSIIEQVAVQTIIDSSDKPIFEAKHIISSKILVDTDIGLNPNIVDNQNLAYILFTSGTTGIPKGVPITRSNLTSFVNSFSSLGIDLDVNDRFLQMFDLTFDLSVWSYLIPLLKGACVYTIPENKIKYTYIFYLIDEYKLTITLMVPSMLQFLRQHFDEIDAPHIRYSLFCGEALCEGVTSEWASCIPSATILNVYGPTENTIFCTHYTFKKNTKNKSINDILCIGKDMEGSKSIIIDKSNQILTVGNKGELCLGGDQLTPNYWKNEKKNKESFFYIKNNNSKQRFYKTGDLCIIDVDEDILYLGRVDFQTQIQGHRVELGEIEFYAKKYLENMNIIVVPLVDVLENTEIGMAFETDTFNTKKLVQYLTGKLPAYMIPRKFKFIEQFPLNINGKTDRNKIIKLFN